MSQIKQMYVSVPDGAVQVQLGIPCPCGEGHIERLEYGRSFGHERATHKWPEVAFEVETVVVKRKA